MNNFTVNFTSEASTSSMTHYTWLGNLEICMLIINFLFGFPTHSYVTWLIVTGTEKGIASGFFNLNLSLCEIGICLLGFFFVLTVWFSHLVALAPFLQGLAFTGRPLFQCLICVERYLAVVHPVTFLMFKPLRYRFICSIPALIITFGSCLFCMFSSVPFNMNTQTWFFSMQLLLFLSVQLFCLLAVLRALKQSGPGEKGKRREEGNHMNRRAFYIILLTTLNMVIIYVPITISGFFTIMTNLYITPLWYPALICYVLAGFVQPVFYLHRTGKLSCLHSS